MPGLRKILRLTACLFLAVTVCSYIAYKLGYDGLLLTGTWALPDWANVAVCFALFSAQSFLLFCVILDEYGKKIWRMLLPYLALDLAAGFLLPALVQSGALPVVYLTVCAVVRRDVKRTALRAAIVCPALMLYQWFVLTVKLGGFIPDYNHAPLAQAVVASVDLIIIIGIFYAIGGEKHYDTKTYKLVLFPEAVEAARLDGEDREALTAFWNLTKFQRVRAMATLLGFQMLQWMVILAACAAGNVLVEGLIISASFIAYGFIVRRRWHSGSVTVCTILCAAMFYAAAKLSPAFKHTQLFPVLIGLLLIYGLYRVSLYTDKVQALRERAAGWDAFVLEPYCDFARLKEIAAGKGLTRRQVELLEWKYCKKANWAQIETRFAPWSQSSIRKHLKEAEDRFRS
ncbi:MAG: hypothetical protein FWG72_01955 [Oscillospiraceae bacterium]|nr:hypothetical protein [Oscillospiraceae bacterium]